MRRSATSVSSNIAEGSSRYSGKEKARHTELAFGSLMELLNQCIISRDLEYLHEDQMVSLREMIDEIAVKSTRLRESQLRSEK